MDVLHFEVPADVIRSMAERNTPELVYKEQVKMATISSFVYLYKARLQLFSYNSRAYRNGTRRQGRLNNHHVRHFSPFLATVAVTLLAG